MRSQNKTYVFKFLRTGPMAVEYFFRFNTQFTVEVPVLFSKLNLTKKLVCLVLGCARLKEQRYQRLTV